MNSIPFTAHRVASLSQLAPLLIAAAIALPARAQSGADAPGGTRIGVGAAVLLDKDGYRGVGTESLVIPGVSVRNKWVDLLGPQLDLRLLGSENRSWWIGPRVEYRQDGYEVSDGAVFNGMSDRKGGFFVGIAARFDLGSNVALELDATRSARKDRGFERGALASLELSRSYSFDAWRLTPRVGLEWQSARYVGYYYGVRPGEATATRPAYIGRSSLSPELGLLIQRRLDDRQALFANFNYERYGSAIRNSPLIEASGIPQVVFGYEYRLK